MFLSFVMPAYNAEKNIYKTLTSIIFEIRKSEYVSDCEIIIINDGSTDNTKEVIEEIILENSDIDIKLYTQKNNGAGGARNTGINYSLGEYIWFFDSDDYIEKNILNDIITKLKREKLDLLELGIRDCYKTHNVLSNINNKPKDILVDSLTYIRKYNIATSPCCYVIRKNILTENSIYFLDGILCEDYDFFWRLYKYCEYISHLGKVAYNYVLRDNSVSRRKNHEFYRAHHESMIKIFEYTSNYFRENDLYNHYIQRHISVLKINALIVLIKSTLPFVERDIYYQRLKELDVLNLSRPIRMSMKQSVIYYSVKLKLFPLIFKIIR